MTSLLTVKLIVLASGAICKLVGELWWHNAQRYVFPVILGIGVSLVSHTWWLGITILPSIGPLCLGYKTYGSSDGFDRAVWLMLIAAAIGLGPILTGHLSLFVYIPYCILSAVWGGVTRAWWNVIIAPISGMLLASIIFFVR